MYTFRNIIAQISKEDYIANFQNVDKFIGFCKQCRQYNTSWACPPYDFSLFSYMSAYDTVYIIGTKIIPDKGIRQECINEKRSKETGFKIIVEARSHLDKQLLALESKYPDSKAFFAGFCTLCTQECTRIIGEPCCYPTKIRHSLESFGFDIGKTASQLLHIDLKWSNDGRLPEYFTLVSGFFTCHTLIKEDMEELFDSLISYSDIH